MATATNYQLTFIGKSGRTYGINGYTADTAGAINTFSANTAAVAGSLPYWVPPEDVVLVDFSIVTGMTQTTQVLTENGAVKNGTLMNITSHLNTNSNRPKLSVPFKAGTLIGANTI
jgi:hypothetical protein